MATRRVELPSGEQVNFDHGAQFVRHKGDALANAVTELTKASAVSVWQPRAVEGGERIPVATRGASMLVGAPAMNRFFAPCAKRVDLRLNTLVDAVEFDGNWTVAGERFDRLVSTVPAPQARTLFGDRWGVASALEHVEISPCWAMMAAFEKPINCGFDTWRHVSEAIGWIARDGAKPKRKFKADTWVVHASSDWSLANLELDKEEAVERLLGEWLNSMAVDLPRPLACMAHRWRYSQTVTPMGAPFHCDKGSGLFVGGDWALGGRVEAAFDSGVAMAEALLALD